MRRLKPPIGLWRAREFDIPHMRSTGAAISTEQSGTWTSLSGLGGSPNEMQRYARLCWVLQPSWQNHGLGEINGDPLEADFGTTSRLVRRKHRCDPMSAFG